MTRKEEEILDKLVRLAGGDIGLVEEAFQSAASDYARPDLTHVVAYILGRVTQRMLDTDQR